MKRIISTSLLLGIVLILLVACDSTTEGIGASMTDNLDRLTVETDTFPITSRTVKASNVIGRSTIGYVGKVRDPETGTYVTGNFITQFHTLEDYALPEESRIISRYNNLPAADSCEIRLYYTSFYGDSLATMKLSAIEMSQAMSESNTYYTDFDPASAGFLRTDGINVGKTYTLTDLSVDDDTREDDDYTANIHIPLNKPYTDVDGKTYNNYGTYVMQKYYENPENFKNSFNLTENVIPGFYFRNESGLGSMAYISVCQLNLFFRYSGKTTAGNDTIYIGTTSFAGTEEVLQTTHFDNNQQGIERLLSDNTCSYLKTPAGLFTELTLPVDEIMAGHENDTLNTAEIILPRVNNDSHDKYAFTIPQKLLLVPSADADSFFTNNEVIDYKSSFIATFGSSDNNCYTFRNIGSLIKSLYLNGDRSKDNWNKVMIIPVTTTTNSESEICKVDNDLSLASTRLVGGSENSRKGLTINVVYSRFK